MPEKNVPNLRLKLMLWAAGTLVTGAALLIISWRLSPGVLTLAASNPASRPSRRELAAQSLSNLLVLCGLIALAVTVVCIAWLIVDARRRAVPAWKRHRKKSW